MKVGRRDSQCLGGYGEQSLLSNPLIPQCRHVGFHGDIVGKDTTVVNLNLAEHRSGVGELLTRISDLSFQGAREGSHGVWFAYG